MASSATPHARRWLLDTNVVVGASLWEGPPWRLMGQAVEDGIELVSSPVLLDELRRTLSKAKFTKRLTVLRTDASTLMRRYESIVTLVEPAEVPRVVPGDADDDHVIAGAVTAQAELIVSGDRDLLRLGSHDGIAIASVREALLRIAHA